VNTARVVLPDDWARLWRLAQRVAACTGEDPGAVFELVGLFVADPSRAQVWDHDATPVNAVTFASTGGDGVHFSIVEAGDGARPVVMTVPMAFDSPNHIVGVDMREFLALGQATGYFCLERLAYAWGRQALIAALEGVTADGDAREASLLGHLVAEFDLRPWPDVEGRLDQLDATYRPHLILRR
jgi:hypothetical protein